MRDEINDAHNRYLLNFLITIVVVGMLVFLAFAAHDICCVFRRGY